jgi:hypothetical protein
MTDDQVGAILAFLMFGAGWFFGWFSGLPKGSANDKTSMTLPTRHITIPIKPFVVPSYVSAAESVDVVRKDTNFPLSEVDADALSQLCDDWRAAVFKKAGKDDPRLVP